MNVWRKVSKLRVPVVCACVPVSASQRGPCGDTRKWTEAMGGQRGNLVDLWIIGGKIFAHDHVLLGCKRRTDR